MDFGFHKTFVKTTTPCLEGEVIVRQLFFYSHAIRLFVLPFILKSGRIFDVVTLRWVSCVRNTFAQTACSPSAPTQL